jgi:putative flippase GtrA
MPFEAAIALAYVCGMVTAYGLSRLLVFQRSGRTMASEFKRFAIVNLFALALVWLVSVGLARFLFPAIGLTWHGEDIAHIIGVIAPAVTSYLGHRHYTFAKVGV